MSSKIILRIFAAIILLVSILYMPFWLSVLLGLAGIAYFSFFVELVVIFSLSDLLYGAHEARLHGMVWVSFLGALIFFVAIELFKRKLRFNAK